MTSSSTSFRSRSYKIKETNVDPLDQNIEESDVNSKSTTCEGTSSTRASWKSSKIFSRTLSSIEVIRAMKGSKQTGNQSNNSNSINNLNSNNNNNQSTISSTKPSVIVTATGDSATLTSLVAPVKSSSKHQHHHEANLYTVSDSVAVSGINPSESTSSGMVRTRSGNSKAASEWKILKNKLSSLRKRSSGGRGGGGDEASSTSISPGPGDDENCDSSGRRLSSNSRTGSARTSRSGSQDEGIVCKREDLINLLTEATKVASQQGSTITVIPPAITTCSSSSSPPSQPLYSSSPASSFTSTTVITTAVATGTSTIKSSIKSDQPVGNVSPTAIGPRKVILKTSNNTVQITGSGQSPTPSSSPSTAATMPTPMPIDNRKLTKKSALKKNTSTESNSTSNGNYNNQTSSCNSSRPNSSADVDDGFVETRIVVPTRPSLKFDLSNCREGSKSNRSTKACQFHDSTDLESKTNNKHNNYSTIVTITTSPPTLTTLTTTTAKSTTDVDLEVNCEKKILIEPDNQDTNETSPSSSSVAAVKWDESNVVDAMILGDAIQAFLKGMEASVQKPTEKRVLFKKPS